MIYDRLALWFFLISLIAHYSCFSSTAFQYDLTWFSFVFPNTALVTATLAVGKAFDIHAVRVIGTVMAVFLVLVWIFVVGMTIRAIWLKRILWPRHDEVDGLPMGDDELLPEGN